MKTIQLVCLLLLFVCNTSFFRAQNYTPIPLKEGAWIGYEYYIFGSSVFAAWANRSVGDSVINGKVYEHLKASVNWYGQPNEYIEEGFARNDTLGHKVYFIRMNESYERVLFDFDLTLGDTLEGYYRYSCGDSTMVFTVSDRYIADFDGQQRIHIEFNYGSRTMTWIEGVGSLGGMIFPEIAMFEGGSGLDCFYPDEDNPADSVLINTFNGTCNLTIGMDELIDHQFIRLSQLQDHQFAIENRLSESIHFVLVDLLGRTVFSADIEANDQQIIQLNQSINGNLFFRAKNEAGNTISTKRLVFH